LIVQGGFVLVFHTCIHHALIRSPPFQSHQKKKKKTSNELLISLDIQVKGPKLNSSTASSRKHFTSGYAVH
jgi:hypothetical protein